MDNYYEHKKLINKKRKFFFAKAVPDFPKTRFEGGLCPRKGGGVSHTRVK